ncbi:DUF5615 family PIN-like protein [Candidatus Pacearchaeota archaeon]|nr:DUF5615 family PIN-like protein [Candidatus Pacearchaeota archaeon]
MKFFLDANIPNSSTGIFKELNYDVQHARDIGMANSLDSEIINYSTKNKRILVTKDLDFGNILNYPVKSHVGVIILRLPFYYNAKQINRVLLNFLMIVKEKEIKNSVTILEIGRYRTRK